jgi:hypothetical protein
MSINFPPYPVPCITPLGDGIIFYITSNSFLENDEITVILTDGGHIKHFTSQDVTVWHNSTYGIKKQTNENNNP